MLGISPADVQTPRPRSVTKPTLSRWEILPTDRCPALNPIRSRAAPGGFGADRVGRDRAAQDVPEVLEGQGSRPGQQRGRVQADAADACEAERAEDNGTRGESGDVRSEVMAALNAGGQVDDLLVDVHGGLLAGSLQ